MIEIILWCITHNFYLKPFVMPPTTHAHFSRNFLCHYHEHRSHTPFSAKPLLNASNTHFSVLARDATTLEDNRSIILSSIK
jgi:hypothetical protein